ncbi:MAG TPA: NAD(P)-dependent oxidoreductase, partial [Burkholderiales bacterium]|nr:NAD(P)-dependent oxidoreductase [Burkholderiales bacterium]
LGYQVDATVMAGGRRLKVVVTNTTGVPHIDVDYAKAHGIRVVSLKDEQEFLATITPTAELALGLMIAVTRNLAPAFDAVKGGKWRRWDFGGSAMLSRMSLGIVGLGRLGRLMARYGAALGMTTCYYDPYVSAAPSDLNCRRRDTLEALVSTCDVTTIHIPMNAQNRHLFNARLFERFKPGSYLINTARGEIVDSYALVEALCSGRLRGAGFDVLDGEFEPGFEHRAGEHPLVKYATQHDNLLLTPHIGGSTRDAWFLTQRRTIEQVIDAMSSI